MKDWTIKDQLFGIASGGAPLIAFVCAASLYITFTGLEGGSTLQYGAIGDATRTQLYIGLCIAYFAAMFFYGIWNLVSLVKQFEYGETIPKIQRMIFTVFVAFGAVNIFAASLI